MLKQFKSKFADKYGILKIGIFGSVARGEQTEKSDLEKRCGCPIDLIIGMDNRNIDDLKRKAPDLESVEKIHQMTEYSQNKLYDHVPDPYYSGAEGFELVLDLLEDACAGLLDELVQFISSNPDN